MYMELPSGLAGISTPSTRASALERAGQQAPHKETAQEDEGYDLPEPGAVDADHIMKLARDRGEEDADDERRDGQTKLMSVTTNPISESNRRNNCRVVRSGMWVA